MRRVYSVSLLRALILVASAVLAASAFVPAQAAAPAFVQINSAVPQSTAASSVSVTFTAAQTAGNLNVVIVGWNDITANVSSLSDSAGNIYIRALGPTLGSGLSQSIYYAKNILGAAAGGNRVTISFSPAAVYPDVRILEYSGIDPINAVDVTAAGTGSSTNSNSGAVQTGNANDLLVGANIVFTSTNGPGTGYTNRVITYPNGDLAEDRVVTSTGSYSAVAPLAASGPWIMQFVAFRAAAAAPPDTAPPSNPSNLSATVFSSSQINLSWSASTDNVAVNGYLLERCQGSGCANFSQIATPTGASFSDSGLSPSTSYSYRVRASDAAGNLSGYSNIATAVSSTPDTTAPTAPSNLTTNALSSTQINLSWTASTDNVAVTGYRLERCQGAGCSNFSQIATPSATNYNDTGRTASTSYTYRVRAADAAGNVSGYSNTVSATTQAPPDTQPPTAPTGLSASAVSPTQINLQWTASTDNVAVTAYLIERCQGAGCTNFASLGTVSTASYNDTGRAPSTTYGYRVRATDAANNLSSYSNTATATTQAAPDTQPPTAPTGLSANTVSPTQINLTWAAATDNIGVTSYSIERCQTVGCSNFVQISTTTAVIFSDAGLTGSTNYGYQIRASDAAGNLGPYSNLATATTSAPDTDTPTAPSNLTATAISANQVNLTWTASSDNVAVTGYFLERCQNAGCTNFTQINAPTGTAFSDTGLPASTTYAYRARATDAANNLGAYSNIAIATTQGLSAPLAFVQANYAVPQTPQTTVSVAFAAAQSAGNLNVVIVGWNDSTAQVSGVTDSKGNSYLLAVGPTVQTGIASQSIYYARNIVAAATNANSVKVTFSAAARYPDIRIAEYSGLNQLSPVDVVSGAQGSSSTSSTPAVATTNANDLLVAANLVQTQTGSAGSGFTLRLVTNPDGDLLEDSIVSSLGSYAASASVSPSANWIMQMVAFRAAGSGSGDIQPPTAPSALTGTAVAANQINLQWTAATDNVAVTGYLIERCQGSGCANFSQINSTAALTFADTGLLASTSYSYRVRATDASGNLGPYSNIASSTTPASTPPDTTPPSVSVSTPAAGATLTGTVTFTATATDNIRVSGLQFQVDGVGVGSALTTPPYSITFDTRKFANGNHSISAYAWDPSHNVGTSSPVGVVFSNTSFTDPAQVGLWSDKVDWPLVAIHVNLLGNGQVLMWDQLAVGLADPQLWDPITGAFTSVATNDGTNIFCGSNTPLGDGRILVAGGHSTNHVGLQSAHIFDPVTNRWSSTPNMNQLRWYPSGTTLPDGRVIITAGETSCADCDVAIPEIYDPATNSWSRLTSASLALPYYPHAFVLSDGRLLVTGTAEDPIATSVLNVATQTWSTVDARVIDAGSSVMYLPDKFLKTGTSSNPDLNPVQSVANSYVLDMTSGSPGWRQVSSMASPRAYHTLTVLPDGNVLSTGGGRTNGAIDLANAVLPAELWSPSTETWTTLSSMSVPRLYHSTALLLPDARVLVAGGGRFSSSVDPTDQPSAQIFAPPYLFAGPRPVITTVSSQLTYGQNFAIQTPDAARIAKVVLVRPGTVTHAINMNQRYIPLTFTGGSGNLTVTAPANSSLAPRGYYMLFLVDTSGVPSVASFVKF